MASEVAAPRKARQQLEALDVQQGRTLLGQRLWQAMVERAATCEALAESVGMDATVLRELTDSRRRPQPEELAPLAALLGCDARRVARIVDMQAAYDRRLAERVE